MMAQFRPDIARVAEQVVVNLKTLETRIEALKYDLANLCTAVGHPEAARVAVSPVSVGYPGITGTFGQQGIGSQVPGFGQFPGSFGQPISPYGFGTYGQQGIGQGVNPLVQNPYLFQGGMGTPWTNPWLQAYR